MSLIKDECVTLILHVTADGVQSRSRDGGCLTQMLALKLAGVAVLPQLCFSTLASLPDAFQSISPVVPGCSPQGCVVAALWEAAAQCPRASQGPGRGTEPLAAHGGGGSVCSEEMKTQ